MRLKRPCRSPACIAHKHRRLHLKEPLSVQMPPDCTYDLRTLDKCIPYLRVHNEIHIPLTVAHIRIRQPVELLRKDLKTLG